nr:ribosome small subunit-dependent GTPase A [Hydromonas sp.]
EVLIVLNKADVSELLPLARKRLRLYAKLGYRVIEVSANQPDSLDSELIPALAGKTTLLMGQSGMGKSSLINALIPDANLRTREISSVLNSGKHTTTFSRLFDCDLDGQASQIIDSPGFEQFGMAQFSVSQIQHAMPEFVPYLGTCKFHNCTHVHEPACAILDAVARGEIAEFRHEFYLRLLQQLDYYEHAQY